MFLQPFPECLAPNQTMIALFRVLKQCCRGEVSESGTVTGVPLMQNQDLRICTVPPATVFASVVCEHLQSMEPSAPPQEDMADQQQEYGEVLKWSNGGMLRRMCHRYEKSFFIEGCKWYDPWSGQLVLATSTADSNVRSKTPVGMPWIGMETWVSRAEGHTQKVGQGMGPDAYMNEAEQYLNPYEIFQDVGSWQSIADFEELLEAAGITEYCRFICGYHIHDQATSMLDKDCCVLDWYFQSAQQRKADPLVWEHRLLLDQVCPTEWYKSRVFQIMPVYHGWDGYRVGPSNPITDA